LNITATVFSINLHQDFPPLTSSDSFKSSFLHANPNNSRLCFTGTGTHRTAHHPNRIFLRNSFSALTFSVLLETRPAGRSLRRASLPAASTPRTAASHAHAGEPQTQAATQLFLKLRIFSYHRPLHYHLQRGLRPHCGLITLSSTSLFSPGHFIAISVSLVTILFLSPPPKQHLIQEPVQQNSNPPLPLGHFTRDHAARDHSRTASKKSLPNFNDSFNLI